MPSTPPRYVDVHHHILPEPYVRAVGAKAIGQQGSSGKVPPWSVNAAIEGMDKAGIQMAITSVSSPGFRGLTAEAQATTARWCNDFAAELCSQHPRRFGMFASLPMADIHASLHELVHAMDTLRSDGVCLLSNWDGHYLGENRFAPLHQELNRRKATVFVHPTSPFNEVTIDRLSASTLEFPFDTTRTLASLVFGGTLSKYPDIRWIFSHAGGAMPYLSGRIETLTTNNPALREHIPNGFGVELGKLYFDCALSVNATAMTALAMAVPASRLLFGTDYPFGPSDQMQSTVTGVEKLDWNRERQSALAHRNAMELFPRVAAVLGEPVARA